MIILFTLQIKIIVIKRFFTNFWILPLNVEWLQDDLFLEFPGDVAESEFVFEEVVDYVDDEPDWGYGDEDVHF